MGVVYKITILETGKSYIGKTVKKFQSRLNEHRCAAKHESGFLFHNALAKHGYNDDQISTEILFESDEDSKLFEKEEEFIKYHQTLTPNGYNIGLGGRSNRVFGKVKVKDSYGNILTVSTDDIRYVSGELVFFHTGMKRTEETKKLQSSLWYERKKDPNWVHPSKGRKLTEDQLKDHHKRCERNKGKYFGEVKLSDDEVRTILNRYISTEFNEDPLIGSYSKNGIQINRHTIFTKNVANEYNITGANIGKIVSGKSRKTIYKEFEPEISNRYSNRVKGLRRHTQNE